MTTAPGETQPHVRYHIDTIDASTEMPTDAPFNHTGVVAAQLFVLVAGSINNCTWMQQ